MRNIPQAPEWLGLSCPTTTSASWLRIVDEILQFLEKYETLLLFLGIGSAVFFVGSLLAIPLIVAYLPADFFVREAKRIDWTHPGAVILKILKNTVGALLLIAGFLMLFLPGQGLLSILLGISLLDFPAKRRWQLALVSRKSIHSSIDWMRRKANRCPIEIPNSAQP
ncbi:MAG: PGPGW domain-containing protein [Puniceicoccales bacterium]